MLTAIQQQVVATLTTTPKSTILEAGLVVKPLLNPSLYLRNTHSSVVIRVTLNVIIDFGMTNVNPLFSGVYPSQLVQVDLQPGATFVHRFAASALEGDMLKHELVMATLSSTARVAGLLIGQYEDVGNFTPTQIPVTL